ncbi:MAG: hypothetical protein KGI19_02620 [Thaumarchaeota archaeon]|nr:hypothetical protein [Nitrososphaerota archaeon]
MSSQKVTLEFLKQHLWKAADILLNMAFISDLSEDFFATRPANNHVSKYTRLNTV